MTLDSLLETWEGVAAVVDGVPVTSHDLYLVEDPATGQTLTSLGEPTAGDVDAVVEAAVATARAWSGTTLAVRQAVLGRTAELLQERRPMLVEAAVRDAGALLSQAGPFQVDVGIQRLRWWAEAAPSTFEVPDPAPAGSLAVRVRRTPVGVVACITPYNFPLVSLASKLGPALASGNTVVVKPAPQDPLLAVAVVEAVHEALREHGLPPGVVGLVLGSGAAPGAHLTEHPDVAAVSFTGSTTVGTAIYRASAPTMKRLLLELGGKGALVIRGDADLDAAVDAAARTWRYHAGQVCRTPARIVAHASVHDEVLARLTAIGEALRYGDLRDPATTTGPVISDVQRERVEGLVTGAQRDGLDVVRFGTPSTGAGHVVPAALVLTDGPEPQIMQEEAFGPVLTLTRADDDDAAVEVANATRFGLTDYVYSRDLEAAQRLGDRLASAQVHLNVTERHPASPFSGNRLSGVGRGGAPYSLDACTNVQATTFPGQL